MNIQEVSSNILTSQAQAIVNPVNTQGVMGKGLALEVKKRYPWAFLSYRQAYDRGELKTGVVHAVTQDGFTVFNLPTKTKWRLPSQLEYVETGLQSLAAVLNASCITSVAVPALGCGNGGLRWSDVRPLILKCLAECPQVHFELYAPGY